MKRLPGFTAGASLYQSTRLYHTAGIFDQNGRSSIHLAQVDVITKTLDPSDITIPDCVEVWVSKYCYRVEWIWVDGVRNPYLLKDQCGYKRCIFCSDGTVSCS